MRTCTRPHGMLDSQCLSADDVHNCNVRLEADAWLCAEALPALRYSMLSLWSVVKSSALAAAPITLLLHVQAEASAARMHSQQTLVVAGTHP